MNQQVLNPTADPMRMPSGKKTLGGSLYILFLLFTLCLSSCNNKDNTPTPVFDPRLGHLTIAGVNILAPDPTPAKDGRTDANAIEINAVVPYGTPANGLISTIPLTQTQTQTPMGVAEIEVGTGSAGALQWSLPPRATENRLRREIKFDLDQPKFLRVKAGQKQRIYKVTVTKYKQPLLSELAVTVSRMKAIITTPRYLNPDFNYGTPNLYQKSSNKGSSAQNPIEITATFYTGNKASLDLSQLNVSPTIWEGKGSFPSGHAKTVAFGKIARAKADGTLLTTLTMNYGTVTPTPTPATATLTPTGEEYLVICEPKLNSGKDGLMPPQTSDIKTWYKLTVKVSSRLAVIVY